MYIDPRDGSAVDWNVGHVSDIAALGKSPDGHHIVSDIKVANFTKSTYSMQDRRRATLVPFANTGDEYTVMVRGREALEQPAGTTASYNRRNHSGLREAKPGHYDDAASQGHKVVCALFEISGACHPETQTMDYLHQLAVAHGDKILLEHKGASWTDTSFLSHECVATHLQWHQEGRRQGDSPRDPQQDPAPQALLQHEQRVAAPPRPEGSLSAPNWRTGRLRATHLPLFSHWVFDALGTPCRTACI